MPKFNVGDKVLYQGQPATIMDVHFKLNKKRMIWYSVKWEGFHSQYAVSQKSNNLKKLRGNK
jgi:hypothetical protein